AARAIGVRSPAASPAATATCAAHERDTCARKDGGKQPVQLARVMDLLDPRGFARLGRSDHMAGPAFARRVRIGKEYQFAELSGGGGEHERRAGLGEAREIEEIILLAEWPLDVVGVVARLGGVENEDAVFADLVQDGLSSGGQVGDAVVLPGG